LVAEVVVCSRRTDFSVEQVNTGVAYLLFTIYVKLTSKGAVIDRASSAESENKEDLDYFFLKLIIHVSQQ